MPDIDGNQTDLLALASQRLDWLDSRQRVLARNIANANTPGYVPRDERPFSASLSALQVTPVQTNPMHMAGTADTVGTISTIPQERAIDGNAVGVEQQLTKVADTDTQQRLVTSLYGKYMNLYAIALGKG